ncbi:MAG: TadE/TadG family type IV pilus assembly protein [Alphaproteobacteria bacterium]
MAAWRQRLAAFWRNDRGVATIEFALALSLLLIPAFIGIVELSRYVQMNEKLDDAAAQLLNAVNQSDALTDAQLTYLADAVPDIVKPFAADGWVAIITAVNKGPNDDCKLYASWQSRKGSGDTGGAHSQVADASGKWATIPGITDLSTNDQVVTVELYLQYKPLIPSQMVRDMLHLSPNGVYRFTVGRPRYGAFQNDPVTGAKITIPCGT